MDFKQTKRYWKNWLKDSLFVLCLFISFSTCAAQKSVNIITDHQTQQHYQSIISSIKKNLISQTDSVQVQVLENSDEALITQALQDHTGCIITLGRQSFERISEHSPTCSLSLLISRSHFQKSSAHFQRKASAIYINQPLKRISAVLRRTLKYAQKASIVVSDKWPENIDIQNIKMDLYIKHLEPGDSIIQAFRRASKNTDFVIAIPDANIYNNGNIKNILLTTYKAKTPLIGYSAALSRAGALISIYTPAEQLGRQAAEWFIHGQEKITSAPKYFKVKLNKKVAQSLNIKLKNEALFKQDTWTDMYE